MTMNGERVQFASRWAERILIAAGIACLAQYVSVLLQSATYQREQDIVLEHSLAGLAVPISGTLEPGVGATPREARSGDLIGRLEIPRLNLSVIITEGDDAAALTLSVGHLPDTPLPWEKGNAALAAHRDTFFRPLKDIRIGDRVRVTTSYGRWEYLVRETLIVDPEDLWVLDPTDRAHLTLITCYPFFYIGHAPQRFVVRADQIEALDRQSDQ